MMRLKTWITRRTVGRDLIAGIVGVASLVVLFMGLLNYFAVAQLAETELKTRLERANTTLVRRLARVMADKDYENAIEILRDVQADLPGSSIRLENESGEILFFHDSPLSSFSSSKQMLETPIEYDKKNHGKIRITMNTDRLELVKKNTMTLAISLITVLIFTLFLTVKIIVHRVLMGSLDRIHEGIRLFSDGDFSYRIAPGRYRDVEPIIKEINTMAQFIANRTMQLQREIGERRRTETELMESRRKLITLFSNLPGMAYRCANDEYFTMSFVSEGVKKLTGYDAGQLIDNLEIDYARIIHPEDSQLVADAVKSGLENNRSFEMEYRIRTADGSVKWVWEQGVGIVDASGNTQALEGFIMDITSRRHAEEQLRKLNEELEMRVQSRTADLEVSNRALKESLKLIKDTQLKLIESEKLAALGSLVAGMAHEINNPLGISVTAASYLDAKLTELTEVTEVAEHQGVVDVLKNLQESTRIIRANIKRASELVTGFKKVAIDQSIEEKRIFNMREYLDEIMLSLRPELKKSSLNVVIDCPATLQVESYPGALSQILTNLVINSVRHGFPNCSKGNINISVKRAARHLILVFADDGAGIPENILSRIFDPFFTTARGQGGSGLGLHIVFSIVSNTLKGDIHCESQLGHGTRFVIRIPYSELGTTLMIDNVPDVIDQPGNTTGKG